MDGIKCFWLEATDLVSLELRRFAAWQGKTHECVAGGFTYHNATVKIGEAHKSLYPKGRGDHWHHEDVRWPTHCRCGYCFTAEDQWQFIPNPLFRRKDTGAYLTEQEAGPGAMRHAAWLEKDRDYKANPDGIILAVKLPDGVWWLVDGPASNHPQGWDRIGTIPEVTAHPSIQTANYHGHLKHGYLVAC